MDEDAVRRTQPSRKAEPRPATQHTGGTDEVGSALPARVFGVRRVGPLPRVAVHIIQCEAFGS